MRPFNSTPDDLLEQIAKRLPNSPFDDDGLGDRLLDLINDEIRVREPIKEAERLLNKIAGETGRSTSDIADELLARAHAKVTADKP